MIKAVINGKLVFPDEILKGILLMDGDKIIAAGDFPVPEEAEIIDAEGLFVGPGLFDQHNHGYNRCGERFDITDDVCGMANAHLKHGTTSITPSVAYNLSEKQFFDAVDQCNKAIEAGDTPVVGIHYEGPFINPLHGANSAAAWTYSDEMCDAIFERGGKNILHCTYAPEMPCARLVEEKLKKHGIIPDIGHTRSDPENIYRAVENGAKIVTHLYDAMGHYRGCDERAFELTDDPQECVSDILLSIPGIYYELVCDSCCAHVKRANIRQTYRCAGEDLIICVSDSTSSPRCLDPDDYPPLDPRSATDLNWNEAGELNGSFMTAAMSVKNFLKNTGCGIRVAFKAGAVNSAKALGLYGSLGSIHAGKTANIIFTDGEFNVKRIFFRGNELPEVRTD